LGFFVELVCHIGQILSVSRWLPAKTHCLRLGGACNLQAKRQSSPANICRN
jgi:hypothetical protein